MTETAVYFLGAGHEVTAVEKSTGRLLWSIRLPVEEPGQAGYGVAFAGGLVIVGDLDVFGLDPVSGAVRWRFHPEIGRRPGFRVLTTDGGVVYCGSSSGHVYAVDAATGAQRWVTAVSASQQTNVWNPVVREGVVYVGFATFPPTGPSIGGAAAIDANTGSIIWTRSFEPRTPGMSTGAGGVVLAGDVAAVAVLDGTVYGLDRTNGTVRWTALPIRSGADVRELAASGAVVYAGSITGIAVALSATDGRELWGADVNLGSIAFLAAEPTRVYATHPGGQLAVFDAASGKSLLLVLGQDFQSQEGFLFPPAIDGDRLYLGGALGLYAFRKI